MLFRNFITIEKNEYVKKVGVSIYDLNDGENVIKTGMIDYIQLPFSILDQRGSKTGFLKRAKEAGIIVFTRSAFLQGLFMMEQEKIPVYLKKAVPYIDIFTQLADQYQIEKVPALL